MCKKLLIFVCILFFVNVLGVSSYAETKKTKTKENTDKSEEVMDIPLEDLLNVEITTEGKKPKK